MKRVLFLQNDEQDGPGLLAGSLTDCGFDLDIVHPRLGDQVPESLGAWSGLAIGGGGMSVCDVDQLPWLQDEIELVQKSKSSGKPILGLCLGAQVLAEALGGKVHRNSAQEIGFQEVRLTPAATTDPLWAGCPTTLHPVHWHGDTFSLPPEATLLASSDLTPHQMFRMGSGCYGLQFHLEIDLPIFTEMVEADYGYLSENGGNPDQFLLDAQKYLPVIEPTARTVFGRWASFLN